MEKVLLQVEQGNVIHSKDHRVLQACQEYAFLKGKDIKIEYPNSVNKSWPQFPRFMHHLPDILIEYKKQQPL